MNFMYRDNSGLESEYQNEAAVWDVLIDEDMIRSDPFLKISLLTNRSFKVLFSCCIRSKCFDVL